MAVTLIAMPGISPQSQSAVDPNLADYLTFIRQNMGIPVEALPDDSVYIAQSFWFAMTTVNQYLQIVGNAEPPTQMFPTYYAYAVYYLAGHLLVTIALDDPAAAPPNDTYFADLRSKMNLNAFVPGVIQSSSDQGTSQSWMVPDFFKGLTLGDMALLQTPWGRAYLALAQAYGPTIWGLTP
jgi:hypothetical protein